MPHTYSAWRYTDAEAVAAVGLICKVIEIGDWNMNETQYVSIPHGLTVANIRSIFVWIRRDGASGWHPLHYDNAGKYYADDTDIVCNREVDRFFDNVNWSETPFNRGWIIIWYKA